MAERVARCFWLEAVIPVFNDHPRVTAKRSWRWEWAGTATAKNVPPWMRPGHGHEGSLHSALLLLVTMREAYQQCNPDWAFRPMWEIDEALGDDRPRPPRGTVALLDELEAFGTVEARPGDREHWRALPLAVEAISESYADRHPMTEDGAPEAL